MRRVGSILATRKYAVLVALLCVVTTAGARADERPSAAIHGATRHDISLLPSFANGPTFYQAYLSAVDERIQQAYFDRWHYHELQRPYESGAARGEHFSMQTWSGPELREDILRQQFASEVLRQRIDGALRSYFGESSRPAGVRKTAYVAERVRQVSAELPIGSGPSRSKLAFAYDFASDQGRIELSRSGISATVMGSRVVSGFTNGGQLVAVSLSAEIVPGATSAYVNLRSDGLRLESGIHFALSGAVSADLTHQSVLAGPWESRYGVTLALNF